MEKKANKISSEDCKHSFTEHPMVVAKDVEANRAQSAKINGDKGRMKNWIQTLES